MRYRTKITILLALLAIFTGAAVSGLYYFQCRSILFRQIQSQVLSIAATGANQITGDLLKQIQRREDETSPAYETIQKTLRGIRDANRRKDAKVRFVYTIRPTPGATNEWSYIVDAEENTKDKSHVGDKVEISGELFKLDQ